MLTRPKPRRRIARRKTAKAERLSTRPCTRTIGVPCASISPMIRPRVTGVVVHAVTRIYGPLMLSVSRPGRSTTCAAAVGFLETACTTEPAAETMSAVERAVAESGSDEALWAA